MVKFNSEDLVPIHDGIAAIVLNDQGEILVQDHVKFNFWTVPVGKCKPGESMEEALTTELKEETGIKVLDFEKLQEKKFKYLRGKVPVEVNLGLFWVKKWSGLLQNLEPQKHRQQKFVPISWLISQNNVSDGTKMAIGHLSRLFPDSTR